VFRKIAALAVVLSLYAVPLARGATTDIASATASVGPYFVNVPITFTSTTPCSVPCRLIWTYLNGTRLGDRIGEGESVQTAFTTPGVKTVQLDLSELCVGTTRLTCDSFAYVTVNVEVPPPTDATTPTITASGLTAEATGPATVVDYTFAATDPDDPVVSTACTPAPGSAFPVGSTPIQCSAVDSNGNVGTASFAVVVSDTTGPTVTVPGTLTSEATSPAGAAVTFDSSATDLVDGAVATSCSTPSGATFPLGTTTVTCTATDAHGNSGSGSFSVVVTDTTAPALSLPATITAEATSAGGASVGYTATASDVVDGAITPGCSTPSGATFALGTTTVTCTAMDAHGNASSGSFSVVVRDTTAPSLDLPGTITAQATSPAGAAVSYTAKASDLVDGAVTPSCSLESGAIFPIGSTNVTCTATDAHGNSSSGSFSVVVAGAAAPTVTVPGAIVVNATSPLGAVVMYTATATDGFGATLAASCSKASGSVFPIGTTTVSCTATDALGNSAAAKTFTVTVKGVVPQLQDLLAVVQSWNARTGGLESDLRSAIRSPTCRALRTAQDDVSALGRKLSADRRAFLVAELARISNVAGCSATQAHKRHGHQNRS
jgi:HYR domain-containing protein